MQATALPRVAKLLSTFVAATFPPSDAFLTTAVEPPPLNVDNIFAVFVVRGEGIEGTAFRILNSPHFHTASAKQGAATAAAAAVAAIVVVEISLEADIVATAILVAGPTSATTDSIIPILCSCYPFRKMLFGAASMIYISIDNLACSFVM